MRYIDTGDKISHKEYLDLSIFASLDSIEHKTKMMAHDIIGLNGALKEWQDRKLSSVAFKEMLNKYHDYLTTVGY